MIRASSSAGSLLWPAGAGTRAGSCRRASNSADDLLKLIGSNHRRPYHVGGPLQREVTPRRSDRGSQPGSGGFAKGKFQSKPRPPPKLSIPDKVLTRIWAAQDSLDQAASVNRNAVEAAYDTETSEAEQSASDPKLGIWAVHPGDFVEIRRDSTCSAAIVLPTPTADNSENLGNSDGEVGDDPAGTDTLWVLKSTGDIFSAQVSDVMFRISRVIHPRLATAARPAEVEANTLDSQTITSLDISKISTETLAARSFILSRLRSIEFRRDSEMRRLLPAFQREFLASGSPLDGTDDKKYLTVDPGTFSTIDVHARLNRSSPSKPAGPKQTHTSVYGDGLGSGSEWSIPPRVSEQISLLAAHSLMMAHPERFMADERTHRETGLFLRRSDAERTAWVQVQKWLAEEQSQTLKAPISKPVAKRKDGKSSPVLSSPSPISAFCAKAASVRELRKSMLERLGSKDATDAAPSVQSIVDSTSSVPVEWTENDRTILTFLLSTVGTTRKIQDEIFGSLAMSILKRAGGVPVLPTLPFAPDASKPGAQLTDDIRRLKNSERMEQLKVTAQKAGIGSPMNLFATAGLIPSFVTEFLVEIGVLAPWTNMRRLSNSLQSRLNGLPEVEDENMSRSPESGGRQLPEIDSVDRTDFGELAVYVIDDAAAHELDDGVSIEQTSDPQEWWIHVHIADPTAVLKPESPLSLRASHMVSTLYFPEHHYPLLPQSFTRSGIDMGSLRRASAGPDAAQRAMTFSARINDQTGHVSEYKINPSLLRKIHVCSYDDVQRIFDGVDSPVTGLGAAEELDLWRLRKVAEALGRKRVRGGMYVTRQVSAEVSVSKTAATDGSSDLSRPHLYLGFPEVNVKLVRQADVIPGSTSMTMVSELMIVAGQVMGAWAQDHHVPMVYRGHRYDSPAKLENARQSISAILQTNQQRVTGGIDPGAALQINRVLPAVGTSQEPLSHMTMGLVFPPRDGTALDALGSSGYVRCTSPLRRYADMITHWQLHAGLRALSRGEKPSEKVPWSRELLTSHMDRISRMEQWQRYQQRGSVRYWQALYLRRLLELVLQGKESSLSGRDRALLQPDRATVIDSRVRNIKGWGDGLVQVIADGIGQNAVCEWSTHEAPPVAGQEIMVQLSFVHIAGQGSQIVVRRV